MSLIIYHVFIPARVPSNPGIGNVGSNLHLDSFNVPTGREYLPTVRIVLNLSVLLA